MGNASDRRQVQAASTREKAARRAELDCVRYLMADAKGRELAHRILTETGCERAIPFNANAMSLSHDVGVHNLGQWLLAEIRAACPEQELNMRREHNARVARDEQREESDDDHAE